MSGWAAGLGALAGGFSSGMERGERIRRDREDGAWQSKVRGRQEKQWSDADALSRDMEAANQAARERLRSHMPNANPMAPQGPSLGDAAGPLGAADAPSAPGLPGAAPAPQGLSLGGAAPGPRPQSPGQPFRPSPEQLLDAARARTDKLFELGRIDQGVEQWSKDEAMRAGLRQKAVEQGMLAFRASGDPTELLKGIDRHLDDGWDTLNITPAPGLGGKAWAVERVNTRTGEKQTKTIGNDQIEDFAAFALNPKESSTYALKQKLAQFEADQKIREQKHKAGEDRETDRLKADRDRERDNQKHGLTLDEIKARAAEERRTKATPGASDSNFTLGEGQQRFRTGRDGKPELIASGAPKTGKPSDEVRDAENLLDTLAKAGIGGTKDLVSGRITPDALTQRAAQRVNQYRKTAGLTFDQAVERVRKEMSERGMLK